MAWDDAVVVNGGLDMLSQTDTGTIRLDFAAGGAGSVDAKALMAQTSLAAQKQTFPIVDVREVSAGKKVNIMIANQGLGTGYDMTQIGIWAHVGDGPPRLFAILQDERGISVPAQADMPDFAMNFYAVIKYSGAVKLQFEIDPSALVDHGRMQAAIEAACEKKQDKLTGAPGKIVGFDENGEAAAQDPPPTGVTSFNGRTGPVIPQRGDYTAAQVGAAAQDHTHTADDVGAAGRDHVHSADRVTLTDETAAKLGLKAVVLKNLLPDSSFEDGGEGWNTNPTSTPVLKECIAASDPAHPPMQGIKYLDLLNHDVIGTAPYPAIAAAVDTVKGHVYYGAFHVRGFTGNQYHVFMGINDGSSQFGPHQADPEWKRHSFTATRSNGSIEDMLMFQVREAWGCAIDCLMLIDLTEAFGAGNEPDQTWCDENIPYFEGSLEYKSPTVDEALEELAGRTDTGEALVYGSDGEAGKFDRLTAAPTATSPLRYNGVFRATKVFGIYFSDSADLAETYAVEGAWEWGDLIAIGADGLFRRNETPENRHVLGFASQRPGVVLGGVDGVPIALAGRVPVRAEGVICAGDFLSAGTEPGTVRAADPDTAPRGSIVAMALEDKPASGVGPVLALVQRM